MRAHFILYVERQDRSRRFYEQALDIRPSLDVPGMTEFRLGDDAVLGLMPETGIRRLLGTPLGDPATGGRPPRAELYLVVADARASHARGVEAGGRELSPPMVRDWGDLAGYLLDPDGHVLAFAERAGSAS